MLVKYKIKKKTYANIENLIRMIRSKISWRKQLEVTPKLLRLNCENSTGILTRSELRDLLFNEVQPIVNVVFE